MSEFPSRKKKTTKQQYAPYLDVMTVHSRQLCSAPEVIQAPSAALVVEPVHVPNLKHTGVAFTTRALKYPLFYPNGVKNVNFRNTIQQTLRTSVSTGQLPEYIQLHNVSTWDAPPSKAKTELKKKSSKKLKNINNAMFHPDRLTTAVKKRNNIQSPSRDIDATTKSLVLEVRRNNRRFSNLME